MTTIHFLGEIFLTFLKSRHYLLIFYVLSDYEEFLFHHGLPMNVNKKSSGSEIIHFMFRDL